MSMAIQKEFQRGFITGSGVDLPKFCIAKYKAPGLLI